MQPALHLDLGDGRERCIRRRVLLGVLPGGRVPLVREARPWDEGSVEAIRVRHLEGRLERAKLAAIRVDVRVTEGDVAVSHKTRFEIRARRLR